MAFTRQDQEECGQCKGMKIVRSQSLIAEAAEGGAEGGRAKNRNRFFEPPLPSANCAKSHRGEVHLRAPSAQ